MKRKKRLWQCVVDFLGDSSPFMTLVGKITLVIVVQICWFLSSLPVVTAGAATAAAYAVFHERKELSYLTAVPFFFRRMRVLWKKAALLWLPFLLLGLFFTMDLWLLLKRQLFNNVLLLTPLLIAASLWGITLLWLFPLLSRRSEQAPGALLRSAFLLGLGELWRSFAAILLFLIPVVLLLFFPQIFWSLSPVWMLAGFSLPAWIAWRLLEPVLDRTKL